MMISLGTVTCPIGTSLTAALNLPATPPDNTWMCRTISGNNAHLGFDITKDPYNSGVILRALMEIKAGTSSAHAGVEGAKPGLMYLSAASRDALMAELQRMGVSPISVESTATGPATNYGAGSEMLQGPARSTPVRTTQDTGTGTGTGTGAGAGTGAGTGTGTGTAPPPPVDDGKIMGLEPMTLALIAAGVGALMLLKK